MGGWQKIAGKSWFGSRPGPGQKVLDIFLTSISHILPPFNPGDNHKVGAIIPILQIKNLRLGEMKSLTVAQLVSGKAGMQTLGQMLAFITFSHTQPWGPTQALRGTDGAPAPCLGLPQATRQHQQHQAYLYLLPPGLCTVLQASQGHPP